MNFSASGPELRPARPWHRGPWGVFLILLAGLGVTAVTALYVKSMAEAEAQREIDFKCVEIQIRLEDRFDLHEWLLRSAAAFFSDEHGTSRQEWRRFAERQKVGQTLPGVQGIGFAQVVPRAELARHIQEIRAGGLPDYRVWPDDDREIYTPVIYLEPAVGRNLRAFGYDMFSEPIRRQAMERARDRDEAALTGRVTLFQETGEDPQPGTLLYLPVYRNGAPSETVAERRAALVGWVYHPYRMRDLMHGIVHQWRKNEPHAIRLRIFDGQTHAAAPLLFDSDPADGAAGEEKAGPVRDVRLDLGGRRWRLSFSQTGEPGAGVDYRKAWLVLLGGTVISGLLSGLAWSLANTRRQAREIADGLTAQLRQSEERWKFALEGAGDGVWDWNFVTGEVHFSRQLKAMLGFAENEMGAHVDEWNKRVHPDDLTRVMADIQNHLERKTTAYVSEHRLRCKDGSWKWILDRGMAMRRDDAGQPLRMIGTHADISERKQAERERFTQSEILKNVAEGIHLVRAVDAKIVFANPRFEKMLGYEPGELIGRDVMVLNAPGERDSAETRDVIIDVLLKTGEWHGEIENIRKDGTRIWCSARVSEFDHAEHGRVFVSVHMDITARKEAEASQRVSESKFRAIINETPVPMTLNDEDLRITYVNPAFVATFGYDLEDIPTVPDWWPKAYPDPVYRQWVMDTWRSRIEEVAKTGNPFVPVELEIRCKDGAKQIVLGSAAPLLNGLEGTHLVILYNITAQKEARDALLVSLREKEALLKEMHHRVKNNLQVVTSLLRLESGRRLEPGARAVLKDMQVRVQTMALLHESLYRSGSFASIDLGAYLRKVISQLFRSMAAHPGAVRLRMELVSFSIEMDQAIPCGLLATELVSNCLKHGFPDGRTGEVHVELRPVEQGARLRLEVSDTGVGLPAEFEALRGESLGLQLVSDLTGQLEGVLEIGPGPAAVFVVTFVPKRFEVTPATPST